MALQQLIALCDEYGRDGKPIFIVSHSLGSLVAAYLLQNQRNLAYAQRIAGIVFWDRLLQLQKCLDGVGGSRIHLSSFRFMWKNIFSNHIMSHFL